MKLASGICLITEDVLKLSEFYLNILQAEAERNPVHVEIPVEGGGITIYAKSAAEKDMGFDFQEYHGTGMCKISFYVDDVDREYERISTLNVSIMTPPTTYPWGARALHFRDLDGNIVCFVTPGK